MKRIIFVLALTAGFAAFAGEYHSGATLQCADCHTMHFSMQHNWDGTTPVPAAGLGGNWLGTTGPNQYLLKAPANQLCLSCHDGQTFAPDVLGANINPSPTQGRSAGAINDTASAAPYEQFKGHTLDSTTAPPGYNPAAIGAPATYYDPTGGLECISCHAQHGPATSFRNLGAYSLGAAAAAARPTYVLAAANDTTKDVWVNLPSYTAGSGSAATFNPYYDFANVSFNRNDAVVATTQTSNRMDTFCGSCHGAFHGGPGDTNIGATAATLDAFVRHPTSAVTLGASGLLGNGGHSATPAARYVLSTTRTRVYASDRTGFTDASPGCLSCHKAHGNQNPFGLFFLNRNATAIDEQGGFRAGQTVSQQVGYRNLCGQCHSQGADTGN